MQATWTKPYYGVQHLGEPGDMRWATVVSFSGGGATVTKNGRGITLTMSEQEYCESIEEARVAGERWVDGT